MQMRLLGLWAFVIMVAAACGGGAAPSDGNPPPAAVEQSVAIEGIEQLESDAFFLRVEGDIQLNVVSGDMAFVPLSQMGEIILRDVDSGYYLRLLLAGIPEDGTYNLVSLDAELTPEQPIAVGLVSLTSPLPEAMYRTNIDGTATVTYAEGGLSMSFAFTAQRDDGGAAVTVRGGFKDLALEAF